MDLGIAFGIGLAIVGKIIEAHRGEIRVKARAGQGTTFTIRLPEAQNGGDAASPPAGG